MSNALYIGLMSGTSLDGVDGVLIDLAPSADWRVIAHHHAPYPSDLRDELMALNARGPDELHRAALAANGVSRTYAAVTRDVLVAAHIDTSQVRAIGAHGQTVRHRPLQFDGVGYTSQLVNGALLAELTGIDVVTDFRSRDLAAGGQGAPLVPAFHQSVFGRTGQDVAVLNVGGIANVTLLPATGLVSGHDCGPGNVLLDLWCQRHTGQPFDGDGQWGRNGELDDALLADFLADAFILAKPPKSTGRDHFHANWLDTTLARHQNLRAVDVQCTLTHFTARAAAGAVTEHLPSTTELLVCGGGALNGFLLECLQDALPATKIQPVDAGSALDPMHIEAAAFAWLAQRHVQRLSGNLHAVTGSRGSRVLGALYPA